MPPITQGALRIGEEEGFVRLSRFTEKQHDALGHAAVINGKDFVPHFPEFYFEESRMHPNDLGCFYYASAIGEAVKNKLFS